MLNWCCFFPVVDLAAVVVPILLVLICIFIIAVVVIYMRKNRYVSWIYSVNTAFAKDDKHSLGQCMIN